MKIILQDTCVWMRYKSISFVDWKSCAHVNILLKYTSHEIWNMNGNEAQRVRHTKDSSCRDRLLINPERHLGKNDGHNARCIYLYHEVAHLPLQVEINCHYYIFTCWKTLISVLLLLTVCKKNATGNKSCRSLI